MSLEVIAKKAGVSKATVSRVLNGSDRISSETSKKVLKVAHALKYKQKQYRRVTRDTGKNAIRGTIGLLWVDINPQLTQHVFFVSLFGELSRALAEQGLRMVLMDVKSDDVPRDFLGKAGVEGLIVMANHLPEELVVQIRTLPAVRILSAEEGSLDWSDFVLPDEARVGQMAAEHFLSNGIRDAVFFNTRAHHSVFVERGEAFVQAMRKAGAEGRTCIGSNPDSSYTYWSMAKLRAETEIVLKQLMSKSKSLPKGIFVPADDDAVVLNHLLHQMDGKLAEKVDVVCCNNDDTLLGLLSPRPVSIDINKPAIAQEAVSRLIKRMNGGNSARGVKILIPPVLVLPSEAGDHQNG